MTNSRTSGKINRYSRRRDDEGAPQIGLRQNRQKHAERDETKRQKTIMKRRRLRVPALEPHRQVKNQRDLRKLRGLNRGIEQGQPALRKSIILCPQQKYHYQGKNRKSENIQRKFLPEAKTDLRHDEHRADADKHSHQVTLEE